MVTRLCFRMIIFTGCQGLECYKLHHEISEALDFLATLGVSDQFEQCSRAPGWLFDIGAYTTQLYGGCNKPI